MPNAYIIDAVRTPRGRGHREKGALRDVPAHQLGVQLLHALQQRAQLDPAVVEDVLLGCVDQVQEQGGDLAKLVALEAGWPSAVAGVTLNRFCGSALEAVHQAAAGIMSGMQQLAIAGGIESMSRVPLGADGGAFYVGSPASQLVSHTFLPQGVSAELIATELGLSRAEADAWAARSHQRAAGATRDGRFRSIIPVRDTSGQILLETDQIIRPESTVESLGQLPLVFREYAEQHGYDKAALAQRPDLAPIHYLHTAGNSSGIVDGASALLIAGANAVNQYGLRPWARIRSWAVVGSDPLLMLTGTVPAAHKALKLAGMQLPDVDLIEVNEAFASVVLYFLHHTGVDADRVNVNGGAIAMGHPLGATGGMLLGTLLDELELRGQATGMAVMCIGAGMGIATIIERI
ncbi:MAG: acetyl-CoA C-acetyltransferase [Sphingobacteriia bacterium]